MKYLTFYHIKRISLLLTIFMVRSSRLKKEKREGKRIKVFNTKSREDRLIRKYCIHIQKDPEIAEILKENSLHTIDLLRMVDALREFGGDLREGWFVYLPLEAISHANSLIILINFYDGLNFKTQVADAKQSAKDVVQIMYDFFKYKRK